MVISWSVELTPSRHNLLIQLPVSRWPVTLHPSWLDPSGHAPLPSTQPIQHLQFLPTSRCRLLCKRQVLVDVDLWRVQINEPGFPPPCHLNLHKCARKDTKHAPRRQHCSAEGRGSGITIQIYTLQPLNSIPGADPLLFSLDCARPATSCTNTPEARTISLFWLPCLRRGACRQPKTALSPRFI